MHLLRFEEQQTRFPHCWKYSVFSASLVRAKWWVVFAHQLWGNLWDFCCNMCKRLQNFTLNSEQTLLTDVYRQNSTKWEYFLGHVVIRPRIRLQYDSASTRRLFLPSRIPPTLTAGVLNGMLLGPTHCVSGSYASLWGFLPGDWQKADTLHAV